MSLVFTSEAYQNDSARPGTHALVVGVGDYPHLIDGSREPPGGAQFPLRQLSSSPVSARAVRDWLLADGAYAHVPNAGLNNPAAPLATVDLLIADANPPAGEPVDVPVAARLIQAINDWVVRCNKHADNVPFLYLCGHGLKLGDLVFLASDFGEPGVPNAWNRAVSLDSIRLGMRKCVATRQFLFFDCCRSYLVNVNAGNSRGYQIFDDLLDHTDNRSYVVMYSTLEGSLAYGKTNQPSYFTSALLDALIGFGSERRGGGWHVTNRMLAKAMHDIMQFDAKTNLNRQLVSGEAPGDAVLHHLKAPPKVKVRVECQPSDEMPKVTFALTRQTEAYQHAGANGPFRNDVSPGEWTIDMIHGNGLPPQQELPVITPPAFTKTFEL